MLLIWETSVRDSCGGIEILEEIPYSTARSNKKQNLEMAK